MNKKRFIINMMATISPASASLLLWRVRYIRGENDEVLPLSWSSTEHTVNKNAILVENNNVVF